VSTRIQKTVSPSASKKRSKYRDFAHTGPRTLAGRYMRTFWQPVYRSQDLPPGDVKPIRILGEDLTLYRGESGAAHLVGFRCRHRGAQLSVGWVEQDEIRCFYHGWKYDARGRCTEQPAEPKPFCRDVKIKSYPVQEYLGLIFAFLGEGEPPELERYPNFEESEVHLIVRPKDHRGYNFFQDFENGMDRVHGGFVHRTLPGSFDGRTDSPLVRAEEDYWGLKTFGEHPSGRVSIQSFGMPNKQHIKFTFGKEDRGLDAMEVLTWKVPLDDENTAHLGVQAIRGKQAIEKFRKAEAERGAKPLSDPFKLAEEVIAGRLRHDDVDPESTNMVWFQDNIVLLAQGAIADRNTEYLGASDAPIVLLRRIWEREMRALDKGRPLKKWKYNPAQKLRKQ